jgi:hypothetical protein
MKPHIHSISSAKKFGGIPEDYNDIHCFMDSSKAHVADHRHRAIFHNSFGCFIVEQVFGLTRINSDKKVYSTRDVAEQHIIEDIGHIPSVQDYLECMTIEQWMGERMTREEFVRRRDMKSAMRFGNNDNAPISISIPFGKPKNDRLED